MDSLARGLTQLANEHSQFWLIQVLGGVSLLSFVVIRTIYRVYFHPLRKIPGPKLAAATHLVEFYYDVVLGGKFCWKLQKMHEKYGE
jgi:hypothetical protein